MQDPPVPRELTLRIHDEDGSLWAEIDELPGCFASGATPDELVEALHEAIELYLDRKVKFEVEPFVGSDAQRTALCTV